MPYKAKSRARGLKSFCPKGKICFKNATFYLGIFFACLSGLYLFNYAKRNLNLGLGQNQNYKQSHNYSIPNFNIIQPPSYDKPSNIFYDSRRNRDTLRDPYAPPLQSRLNYNPNSNTNFSQIGLLTAVDNGTNSSGPIPLMGKPINSNRNKWQYYSMSDQFNRMKLPVKINGKKGMTEYGINEVVNGDNVFIDGLNSTYKVSLYENDNIPYDPFVN